MNRNLAEDNLAYYKLSNGDGTIILGIKYFPEDSMKLHPDQLKLKRLFPETKIFNGCLARWSLLKAEDSLEELEDAISGFKGVNAGDGVLEGDHCELKIIAEDLSLIEDYPTPKYSDLESKISMGF